MVETHGMLALSFGRELCHLPPSWRALLMPLYVIYRRPQRCDSSGHCPNRGASRYLLKLAALCPSTGRALEVTRCAITRCLEIMTPQLSIVKTRFAKASLRARCARHRSWRPTCKLPNRRAGTLSYPIIPLVVNLPNRRAAARSLPSSRY